jgi:hypothetical protein
MLDASLGDVRTHLLAIHLIVLAVLLRARSSLHQAQRRRATAGATALEADSVDISGDASAGAGGALREQGSGDGAVY